MNHKTTMRLAQHVADIQEKLAEHRINICSATLDIRGNFFVITCEKILGDDRLVYVRGISGKEIELAKFDLKNKEIEGILRAYESSDEDGITRKKEGE